MFSERLGGVYTALEEKYYAVLDFFDEKGIPVYTYNDFLEEKGLPAFPVTIALIVLLLAGIYGLAFVGNTVDPQINISFADQFGDSVSGVTVSVRDSGGRIIKSPEKVSSGETITLQGIPLGTTLTIIAEKEGFDTTEQAVDVTKQSITEAVSMQRQVTAIVGEMQFVDSDTGDPIRNALVTAEWMGSTKSDTSDSEGKVSFAGIPSSMDVLISIQADGYETLVGNYSFFDGELKEVSLVANSASLLGNASVIISVLDEEGSPVNGAKITVWDRETDTSIEERTIDGSETLFSIAKGTSARLIVQKDGFLRYDSVDFDEGRTLRQDEELWPVVLEMGGTRLVVTVFVGPTPLSDATVQLFDLEGNLIEEAVTGFGGTVDFSSLEPKEYYITGYKQGYLPLRSKVNVAGTETAPLAIEPADSTNSSYVGISVLDSYKAMANNADLTFKETVAGEQLPLGIPPLKTDASGYASIIAKTGSLVFVEAIKEMQAGFDEKLVEANRDNQLVIELSKPIDIVELQVLSPDGTAAEGHAVIETVSGQPLFDGEISEGSVFFDSEGNKDIVVGIETLEGETFSQRVSIEGKETVQINLAEAATGIAPTITFTGVFNEIDEETEGIVTGQEYWLGFQASWPTGVEKGGIHIRIGLDGIAFVDSQEAGITGFEATTTDYFYGESYQPLPSPGNETADLQNIGQAGQMNKLLELYFEEPENTIAFKVRVKAQNQITEDEIELHYRAWSEAGGKYFRTPADSELGEESFSETKTSLYAASEKETVQVFRSEAECEQELCGSYFFVRPNGLYVDRQDFRAVTEELYALEIDLSAKKPLNVTLNLNTDKAAPKLQFTGYDVDEFIDQEEQDSLPAETDLSGQGYLDWPLGNEELQTSNNPLGFKQGSESTSITITGLGVSPERSRKVRAYFRATEEGLAEIKMQAVAESVLEEIFPFQIERNKQLLVSVSPREPGVGEPFTIKVLDGEDGSPVQEANVQIKDVKENLVDSVVGRGSTRRGLNGEYYFKNSLEPGLYTISVSAAGYVSDEFEIAIARNDVLQVKSPVKIEISKEQREATVSISMHNSTAEEIKELGYEIEKEAGFPEEFSVSVSMPARVSASQDSVATVHVLVNLDDDSEDNLYGEAKLVLHGMVAGNYPTKSETTLRISYNKPLDPDCLYFDEQHLIVKLVGRSGSSATEEIEVENNCDAALNLRAKVEAMQEDPNLTVTVAPLRIERDAIEKVKVTISNRIERMYDLQSRRDYKITFESSQIAKTIPLSVELWNPRTNLSYPPNLSLWMARSAAEELAYAQNPLQILNNGPVPITAFNVAVTPEAYMQGITVGITPSMQGYYDDRYGGYGYDGYGYGSNNTYGGYGYGSNYGSGNLYGGYGGYNDSYGIGGITLAPGMPLTPQRYVYAETKRTEALTRPGQGWVQFYGTVNGRRYPDLGRASLTVNYSGTKCLTATAVDSMVFSSKQASQGTLERTIRIKNECGEEVRISGNTAPKEVSGNTFVVSPSGGSMALMPNQEQDFKLILLKGQETNRSATIKVLGLLTRQNKWIKSNELQATLKLGEQISTTEGKATSAMSIDKCLESGTKELAFPILSSDCGEGYCDAKQLSEYITAKADNTLKMAEDKARRNKYNASEFGNCAEKEFCEFERMGIITDRFPVYLQLDNMTSEVLRNTLKQGSKTELESYDVVQGSKSIEDIGTIGFDFGNVYLGGNFRGCGKYYVDIIGAVRVDSGDITIQEGTRNFVLSINVSKRVTTNECYHRVENVANFLPVDEGYNLKQHFKAWPGLVKADSQFEELAKEFAKELFGTADGRYSTSISATSNKLEIIKGNTGNGLLKIRITKPPIGETNNPDQPKTVYAHIPDNYTAENTNMTTEIAKAFRTFKESSFGGEDACWGEDDTGQYIVMKTYTDMEKLHGKLEIKSKEKAIRINNQRQCIDLNITSKSPEKTWFSTDFLNENKKPKAKGIEYVEIVDLEGKVLLKENANGERETGKELLLKKDEKLGTGVYVGKFKFCVKGNEKFPLALETLKSISITGYGTAFGAAKARKTEPPYEVAVEACGMHPYDLVKKMGTVQLNEIEKTKNKKLIAYVTLGWKGTPPEVDIRYMQNAVAAEAAMDKARGRYGIGQNVHTAEQPTYMTEIAWQRLKATWIGYVVPCSVMAVLLNWWTFGVKGGWDIGITCIAPASWASKDILKDMGGSAQQGAEFIEGVTSAIVEWIPFVGDPLANVISPEGTTNPSNIPSEEKALEDAQNANKELFAEAVTGVSFRDITRSVSVAYDTITPVSAGIASREAGDAMVKQMIKSGPLKGMTPAQLDFVLGGTYKGGSFVKGPTITSLSTGHTLPGLRETLVGKINSNLLADSGKSKISQKILAASQQGYNEAGASMIETFGEAGSRGMLTNSLDNAWLATQNNYLNKLISMDGVTGPYLDKTITKLGSASTVSSADTAKAALKARAHDIIEDRLLQSADGQHLIRDPTFMTEIDSMLDTRVGTVGYTQVGTEVTIAGRPPVTKIRKTYNLNVDPDDFTRQAVREAQKKAQTRLMQGAIGTEAADDFARNMFTGADELVDPSKIKNLQTRTGRFKAAVKNFFSRKFWNLRNLGTLSWNLLKGAGVGAAEIWAGMAGHSQYWEQFGGDPVAGAEQPRVTGSGCIDRDGDGKCNEDPVNGIDDDGDELIDEDYPMLAAQLLEKGQTYRLEIIADQWGKVYNFTKLEKEEDFERMKKELAGNRAVLWEEASCKNFLEKTVHKYLGGLAPVPSKSVKPENVMAYYTHNSVFADAGRGDPNNVGDDFFEDELVAILTVEPEERIKGCNIPKEWYRRSQGEAIESAKERAEEYIKCAAKALRAARNRAGPGASFKQAAEELVKGQKNTNYYVKSVVEVQQKWEPFRIKFK